MGRFADYLWTACGWNELDPDDRKFGSLGAPWLHLSIHDSDFATVRFSPNAPGTGVAFLGITARDYFGDPEASAFTDLAAEASGLVNWARAAATGVTPPLKAVEELLAADRADPFSWKDPALADDEVLVEGKCCRFVVLLGLPTPPGL